MALEGHPRRSLLAGDIDERLAHVDPVRSEPAPTEFVGVTTRPATNVENPGTGIERYPLEKLVDLLRRALGDDRHHGGAGGNGATSPGTCCPDLPASFRADERSRTGNTRETIETCSGPTVRLVTPEDDIRFLRRTIELADEAVAGGNHPFGSLIVDASGTIIGEGGNEYTIDKGPGHAETNLARRAAREHSVETLRGSTLYTSVEPCCMCAGTTYWAEIGTLVYGMSEKRLAELTEGDEQNPTQDLDCRTVFAAGRNHTEVRGPYPELEEEIAAQHASFWNDRDDD